MDEKENVITITDLIERDPRTQLNGTYKSALLNKIKETFTDEEQQLYVTSFYCYLNYDSEKDFVIDFDDVWKWCGFTRRDNAKTLLEKHFTEDVDYKIEKITGVKFDPEISGDEKEEMKEKKKKIGGAKFDPEISGDEKEEVKEKNTKKEETRGGHNKERITLNIDTFKQFCMTTGTKKAKEIQKYYIKLEKLLHKTIQEQSQELQLQLETQKKENQEQLENKQKEIKKLENKILNKQKRVEYPGYNEIYVLSSDFHRGKRTYIIGKAFKLKDRLTSYNKTMEHTVEFHRECKNFSQMRLIETFILYKLDKYREIGNRDRFILPENKDLTLFTNVINQIIDWFQDVAEDVEIIKDDETINTEKNEIHREYRLRSDDRRNYEKNYEEEHKEELKEKKSKYYEEKKEEIKEKTNLYKKTHKESRKQYQTNYEAERSYEVTCECGKKVRKIELNKHLKRKIHTTLLEKKNSSNNQDIPNSKLQQINNF